MRTPLLLRASAALMIAFLSAGCDREEEAPSYVGKWVYSESDPDVGPEYAGSYFIVEQDWDFLIFDASDGSTAKGTREDFTLEGSSVVLTLSPEYGSRTFLVSLLYLKNDRMVVETSSVSGAPSTICFARDPDSY